MPHNLYLHSSIVQTRQFTRDRQGKKEAIKFSLLDSTFSLTIAFLINSGILILGAAAFHGTGLDVSEIEGAYKLLSPTLGVGNSKYPICSCFTCIWTKFNNYWYFNRANRYGRIR